MSIMTGILRRHADVSGVSGVGDIAEFAEFSDGAVAVRWHGDHPSTAAWNDIRDVEFVHGHQGATEILPLESERLVRAYQAVMPWLLEARESDRPKTCAPHVDHPDRLLLTFANSNIWRFWIALLEGSSDAASHVEVNGEIEHTWISSDGNVWLTYYSLLAPTGSAWDRHDDPEVQP
jgi:hypothetical protein